MLVVDAVVNTFLQICRHQSSDKMSNLLYLVQFHKISQAMEEQGDYAMNPYSQLLMVYPAP